MVSSPNSRSFSTPSVPRLAVIWALFLLICFSLGYPTLNRYSPSEAGTHAKNPYAALADTQYYTTLIEKGFAATPDSHWRYRVLVPYVAKPFHSVFKGRIGTWDPVFFSLLVANSIFISLAAVFLFLAGGKVTDRPVVGFVAALLLLCHFNVSNLYLAGLVDSGELFVVVLTAWLLLHDQWRSLPLVAVVAALARETAVAFTAAIAAGWFLTDVARGKIERARIAPIVCYGVLALAVGIGTILALRYAGTSQIPAPWLFADNIEGAKLGSIEAGLRSLVTSKALFYAFVWLLPLGLLGIRRIPRTWLVGSVLAAAGSLVMIVIMHAGENAGRPLFNTAGPMLLVAAAAYLVDLLKLDRAP